MFPSKVKAKWSRGEPALFIQLHLTDSAVPELAAMLGFDGIWIDLEHHVHSLQTVQEMMRAAQIGSSPDMMLRPAKGEFMRMGRMLEAGAHGILYPRCDDAAEAAEVVRWSKFAPLGERGFDGGNRDMPYCMTAPEEYLKQANEETFIFTQIESPAAVEQARAIAEVEGIDGLFFGPGDFSILSGVPFRPDSRQINEAIRHIAEAAARTGKRWGAPASSAEHARELISMGATLVCHGADVLLIRDGLRQIQEQFAAIGFTFDRQLAGN